VNPVNPGGLVVRYGGTPNNSDDDDDEDDYGEPPVKQPGLLDYEPPVIKQGYPIARIPDGYDDEVKKELTEEEKKIKKEYMDNFGKPPPVPIIPDKVEEKELTEADYREVYSINVKTKAEGSSKFLVVGIWDEIAKHVKLRFPIRLLRPDKVRAIFDNYGDTEIVKFVIQMVQENILNRDTSVVDFLSAVAA
jgi:hypothetical protein